MLRVWVLMVLAGLTGAARAEPIRLRFGTMAPEGTAWAREMHGFTREASNLTGGAIQLKWYLGGIVGDEFATIERIRKGQLDGAGISLGCTELAPSLRVTQLVGLIRSRDESRHVLARMHKRLEQEFAHSGFVHFGVGNFGEIVLFTRTPVRTFDELKKLKLWVWDRDAFSIALLRKMGLQPVALAVDQGGPAYEAGRIDGFIAAPGAALVFQWSTQARYFTMLNVGLLPACLVLSQRAYDLLPIEHRKAFGGSGSKFVARFEEIGRQLDQSLTSGLLQKQGLKRVDPDEAFQSEFYTTAAKVRGSLDPNAISPALISEVLGWLADYRADQR